MTSFFAIQVMGNKQFFKVCLRNKLKITKHKELESIFTKTQNNSKQKI